MLPAPPATIQQSNPVKGVRRATDRNRALCDSGRARGQRQRRSLRSRCGPATGGAWQSPGAYHDRMNWEFGRTMLSPLGLSVRTRRWEQRYRQRRSTAGGYEMKIAIIAALSITGIVAGSDAIGCRGRISLLHHQRRPLRRIMELRLCEHGPVHGDSYRNRYVRDQSALSARSADAAAPAGLIRTFSPLFPPALASLFDTRSGGVLSCDLMFGLPLACF